MNAISLRSIWLLAILSLALGALSPAAGRCQDNEQQDESQELTDEAAERFQVPDGTPEELLKFIEKLAEPDEPYSTRAEIRLVASAISGAADKMLAAETTDVLLKEAVEWRIGSLFTLAQLGDREASEQIDEVLAKLAEDPRPVVAEFAN
jgi:hypothetical protein